MKDPLVFIKYMLESIGLIQSYVKGKSKEDLEKNIQFQDAIVRRFEILGEAAKNLDENFKQAYSNIEWKKIIGTRDIIVHRYFGVDLETIWLIIEKDLPELKNKLNKILGK